jgi:excinuclease ABC subunit C
MKVFSPSDELARQLSLLPDQPGVYIFRDARGDRIYIGKALSLKSRVRSYWNENSWNERPKLAVMMPKVDSLETIVTNSEKEALLLEAHLVRQHMPRYNVHLKDDKKYPWLAITYDEPFPRLIMVRDPVRYKKDSPKSKVFGPYVETGQMWETVRVLRRVFPMRQRRKPLFKDRPCMNFHIGLCLGPCQNLVEESFYNAMVAQVELFLSGSQSEAVRNMEKEMEAAAEALKFEEAAKIRDRITALQTVLERQRVFFQDSNVSNDIIAESHTENQILICMMRVREGKLIGSENFDLPLHNKTRFDEAFQSFIEQYYAESEDISIPREVILQHQIEDESLLIDLLSHRAHRQIKVYVPRRGDKVRLIEMAQKNASQALEKNLKEETDLNARVLATLTKLKEDLQLTKLPRRIECFDISNIQGTDNVASMVVFENAQSKKSDYRLFKIRSVEGHGQANDFASMKEAVGRRYGRLVQDDRPLPDLIIIDGGKGQLNAAREAIDELGIAERVDMMGLAKKQEEVYLPGKSDPVFLPRRSDALFLLQRARDEAHRFAITYHRKLRAKRSLRSGFDDLPNVGDARRKKLMVHFSTFEALSNASLADLQAVPSIPKSVAQAIYTYLHPTALVAEPSAEYSPSISADPNQLPTDSDLYADTDETPDTIIDDED